MTQERMLDEQKAKRRKLKDREQTKQRPPGHEMAGPGLASLQQLVGNRAVQRLLAQSISGIPRVIQRRFAEPWWTRMGHEFLNDAEAREDVYTRLNISALTAPEPRSAEFAMTLYPTRGQGRGEEQHRREEER